MLPRASGLSLRFCSGRLGLPRGLVSRVSRRSPHRPCRVLHRVLGLLGCSRDRLLDLLPRAAGLST